MITKGEKGQILSEAIIAISIITIGIFGVVGFLASAIGQGRYVSEQTTAVHLAGEGVEIMKSIIDANAIVGGGPWNEGVSNEGYYEADYRTRNLAAPVANLFSNLENICRSNWGNPCVLSEICFDTASGYWIYGGINSERRCVKRAIRLSYTGGDPDQIRIVSTVFWRAKSGLLNDVSITSDLFNWR